MKNIIDYLKENKKYTHDISGRNFELELEENFVKLKYNDNEHKMSLCPTIGDMIWNILYLYGIEIRYCKICGKPFDEGFTTGEGWNCCEDCFEDAMDKDYGKGYWRSTTEQGYMGGYYEYLTNDGTWEDTGVYWTDWY